MSYRPRSRSPPPYRQRHYSPSRPFSRSPSPPRRYDSLPPVRDARYPDARPPPPPPRRYEDDYPPRRPEDDYPPRRYEDQFPPRRYDDEYPPRRNQDEYPPRRDQDARGFVQDRYIPPPRDRDRREDYGYAGGDRDREEVPPRGQASRSVEPQWERGRDVEELGEGRSSQAGGEGSKKGAKGPSVPSRDVIFLGLDPELTDSDLMGYLRTEHDCLVDSVKIVRDKFTGASKFFGFAQFADIEGAEEFVNNNWPAVLMPALYAHSDPRKVKIDFSTPQGVPNDSSAQTVGPSSFRYDRPLSDGMRDIGPPGPGKRVLLLRGLDYHASANEVARRLGQEVARMLGKQGREREAEKTVCRVVLIVDRESRSSWGFAFVELVTAELAAAMLPFLLNPASQPQGFCIHQRPVAVSFVNPGTFIATPAGPLGAEFLVQSCRNGGIGSEVIDNPDGEWVAYWHEKAGALELVPGGAPTVMLNGELEPMSAEIKMFLGSLAGRPAPSSQAAGPQGSTPGVAISGQTAPISISMTAMQPIKIGLKLDNEGIVPISGSKRAFVDEEDDAIGKDTVLLSRTKGVASIIGPSSRKVAKNIDKWNTKKTELKAPVVRDVNAPPKGLSGANAALGTRVPQPVASGSKSPSVPKVDSFDYTDTVTLASSGKVACLLCQRQFKTEEMLKKHNAQSELHKTNLLDAAVREAGQKRKNAAFGSGVEGSTTEEGPKYRDRAAERRIAFNQPDRPDPAEVLAAQAPSKQRKFEGPKPAPPGAAAEPSLEPGKDEANKGNQLLAKMGWKSGTGLGVAGEGRVEPVMVQQFENRAGLGAAKGHDAASWQGPGGFQRRALDMVSGVVVVVVLRARDGVR
ncbi:hypothetical protein BCR39DRAFT_292207 [Naematelia encephala]|uniref:G-patch domain-containing protein n=1 Tax=Naematelia encephala TaxID=71784 RepID=A0A1Y2ASS9_9TREE|nr:hypothetical protein BCR39DRAFT_292207 [Naematelia encephala]